MSQDLDEAGRGLRIEVEQGLIVFALWGLAVAQPLLDLFGKTPEFFVAAELSRGQIVGFALCFVFVGPIVLIALQTMVHRVSPRAGLIVHRVIVSVLGFAFAMGLLVSLGLDGIVLTLVLAVPLTLLIYSLDSRWEAGRTLLCWLALAPIAFVAVFVWGSPTSDLLWADQAVIQQDISVGRPAPLVMVVFDELPTASLLRTDGTINERRFPNFARLAAGSTWYREAVSVAAQTTAAVPGILTGGMPVDGALPTSASYPDNLFTLLGGSHELQVTETVTNLCPDSACDPGGVSSGSALWGAVVDAVVAYGHLVLPPAARGGLPAIDETWGGFVGEPAGPEVVDEETRKDFMGEQSRQTAERSPAGLGSTLSAAIETTEAGDRSLIFLHDAFVPHRPWRNTQTGARYDGPDAGVGTVETGWPEDETVVREGFQRHLVSVGYADLMLGRLIDRLEEQGHWDDAMVVVTADHGVGFDPGSALRPANEGTVNEVFNVPLFVKEPGQVEARVDDRDAATVDILPTIVDEMDIEVDWRFDGRSLLGAPERDGDVDLFPAGLEPRTAGFDGVLAAVERNREEYLPYGENWLGVAQVGALGERVGDPVVAEGPAEGLRWALDNADALVIDDDAQQAEGQPIRRPVVLTGTVTSTGAAIPDELLVGLNGHVAGVATLSGDGDTRTFSVLVAERYFIQGDNDVTLLAVDRDDATGALHPLERD